MKKEFTKSQIAVFIFLASFLILILPQIIRYFFLDNVLIGEESYYNARIASNINREGVQTHDELSYGGVDYVFNPYHPFLAFFSSFLGVGFASKIVPLVLGIISLFLFYYILRELKFNFERRFFSTMILLLSPSFIFTFVASTSYSLIVFLFFLCFSLFITKNKYLFLLYLLLLFIIPLFGFFHALVFAVLIFSYVFYRKKAMKKFFISLIPLLFSSLYYFGATYSKIFSFENFLSRNIFRDTISGLGSYNGLSIFAVLLALVGVVVLWKHKKEFYPIYMNSIVLILLLLYKGSEANIYLAVLFSIFGGLGFYKLMKRRWEAKTIKNLTLLLLITGLILTSASYIPRIINFEPDKEVIESLEWLQSQPKGIVLSHHSNGFWIEHSAEMVVFMDSNFQHSPDTNKRHNISETIFYSRDLRNTRSLLKENNIGYIWIDDEMKNGEVWKADEEGMLFLLQNNETFKSIYNKNNIEIWKVLDELK
ncbi:hypothetical protein HQ529_00685 [Candidatus Woesearchaeota archaeon]|nr:hypothetical protein [Candidatus Woesearchaeota archaeon]